MDTKALECRDYSVSVGGRLCHAIVISSPEPKAAFGVVNIHGYFASAAMYRRESEYLAATFGWNIANIDLPGFGASEPLENDALSLRALSDRVEALIDGLEFKHVLLIGHSMGASLCVDLGARIPQRVMGIVYRAGIATPSWQSRTGMITKGLRFITPNAAPVVDLVSRAALDIPDLFFSRTLATARSLAPDLSRNIRSLTRTSPFASLLFGLDQRDQLAHVVSSGIPLLPEWGCFDYVIPARTADEFATATGTSVQWIPGGHSWMLARPSGQRDVLNHLASGQQFMSALASRHRDAVSLSSGR